MERDSSPDRQRLSKWHLVLEKKGEEIVIDKGCREGIPCQHSTNGKISENSHEIWRVLRKYPELETREPELWAHFQDSSIYFERYQTRVTPEFGGPPRIARSKRVRKNSTRKSAPNK